MVRISNLTYNLPKEKVLAFFKQQLGEKFLFDNILMNESKGFAEILVSSKEIADCLIKLNGKVLKF